MGTGNNTGKHRADYGRGEYQIDAPDLLLTLTHQSGVFYTELAGEGGAVRFAALPPGRYTGAVAATDA